MRTRATSAEKYGRRQRRHDRQPTCLTTPGGCRSVSNTGSRRVPPSHGHCRASTNPRPSAPRVRTVGRCSGVLGGATGTAGAHAPLRLRHSASHSGTRLA